ncbi:MAG: translocation/assembly module TamB domain-containing protein, partial [Spirochaetaceae bacterium]|nr:translocation/assembly module TamB domain-containing protein [Spirochaetaceae bacterium]
GDLYVAVKELFPVRLTATGSIDQTLVDLNIQDFYFDPVFINYFMPTDPYKEKRHVVFKSGNITGDIRIDGKISDPDFHGVLNVNDIAVESPYIAEIPQPASTKAYLDGHSMILDPLVIQLKNGSITVDSAFEFDGGLPTIFDVNIDISGGTGVRVAYEIPSFSWDGHFTGTTQIKGSKEGGFLRGDLICNDLVSSMESSADQSTVKIVQRSPSVEGFLVDLTIQTGRDVNFYFPNQQVPIIQATADNGDTMNITYDSRSDVLALVGKLAIRTGEINYFNKAFFLKEGFIDFNESQVKFNPWLNVRADVVTKDDLGKDVTISLLFDDYLFNEFNPEFLSFPRKSENEILALLGQSFIPSNDPEQVSVASMLVATGGMIGKNTIIQPLEDAIKSSFNLDFVSFNTDIIENAILDRFQDQEFYSRNNQGMNFAKYLENTSLFVGEYLGDYLFLEGSLVVDYDEANSVSSPWGGLDLNVNLNLQFITPFVLIDWTYDPKNNPGSDYFFPQNTISFTWQYSY